MSNYHKYIFSKVKDRMIEENANLVSRELSRIVDLDNEDLLAEHQSILKVRRIESNRRISKFEALKLVAEVLSPDDHYFEGERYVVTDCVYESSIGWIFATEIEAVEPVLRIACNRKIGDDIVTDSEDKDEAESTGSLSWQNFVIVSRDEGFAWLLQEQSVERLLHEIAEEGFTRLIELRKFALNYVRETDLARIRFDGNGKYGGELRARNRHFRDAVVGVVCADHRGVPKELIFDCLEAEAKFSSAAWGGTRSFGTLCGDAIRAAGLEGLVYADHWRRLNTVFKCLSSLSLRIFTSCRRRKSSRMPAFAVVFS